MCNHSPSPASFLLPFVVASDSSSAPTVEHPPRVTIKQLLHSQLATGRQREAPQVDTAALHQAMSDLLKDTWADSTWARRRSLYQQYLEFQLQRGLPPLLEHQSIIEFVVAKSLDGSISMRTAAQYMRELRALMTAMNDDPIKLATRAMMRRGATTIEEAALPFPKATFYALLMTLPPDPRIPLFLAWKTASRWGHGPTSERGPPQPIGGGDSHRVSKQDEDIRATTVPLRPDCSSSPQGVHVGRGSLPPRAEKGTTTHHVQHQQDGNAVSNCSPTYKLDIAAPRCFRSLHSAQHQARRSTSVDGGGSRGKNRNTSCSTISETSGPSARVPNDNVPLRGGCGPASEGPRISQGNVRALKWLDEVQDKRLQALTAVHAAYKKSSSRLPRTAEEWRAPLHAKKVKPWDAERLLAIADSTPYGQKLREVYRFVNDVELYKQLAAGPDEAAHQQSEVSPEHLQQLLSTGIFEEVPVGTVRRTSKLFMVYEDKHRLRVIQWPKQLNEEIRNHFESAIELSSVTQQCSQVRPGSWAVCHDLATAYYQGELHPDVRPYYGIKVAGREYVATRMVMGGVPFAEVCDFALKALAHSDADVTTLTHIDNVRFVGTEVNVSLANTKFISRAKEAGVTLNEEDGNTPHHKGVFCGVRYDVNDGTVHLTDKTVTKLTLAAADMASATLTNERVFVIFGLLIWASAVARAPMHKYYYAIKFIRRRMSNVRSGKAALSDYAAVWSAARPQFVEWFDFLKRNKPTKPKIEQDSVDKVLFTDASKSGCGGVLFSVDTAEIEFHAETWSEAEKKQHINELELLALRRMLVHWANRLDATQLRIMVDNTTAKAALLNGRSGSYHINQEVSSIDDLLAKCASTTIHYIKSEDNPADAPSRGTTTDFGQARLQGQLASEPGLRSLLGSREGLSQDITSPRSPLLQVVR